ncbi:serine dehydratase subunit alpha family protein [Megasphaera stantonii]|uniref:L-cysteine desulfidase family protein n=1 Tax=Megasphaera stantonii TaxID=2144175 RepID=UPI00195E009E|nr:L-serine ammonia-lyase, iron-sulfur-dependent, subunit alpha [Megasphaera stantonii]
MEQKDIADLIKLLRDDMKPALGVTEPGAIAFAAAKAREFVKGEVERVDVVLNSGMYKNAFTCGIPHSDAVGNAYAAALGVVAGDAALGLEALAKVDDQANEAAKGLVEGGKVSVQVGEITPDIYIRVEVATASDCCAVTIAHTHTNIVNIVVNGDVVFEKDDEEQPGHEDAGGAPIHEYTLAELYNFIQSVPIEEISFIQRAYDMNLALFSEGLGHERTTFLKALWDMNGGQMISGDEVTTAQLLCGGAIEARVLGLDKPAMSITGSGAHGIICTMPLYAVCQVQGISAERLLRATALSYLITMYIKEYSGRLSAFCGCAIAAGTGMACALAWLKGGDLAVLHRVIANMAASITGMICDGGNQGCTMKGVTAVDTAFRSVRFALSGVGVDPVHGVLGPTPEDTFRYMGCIASPGMVGTEQTMIDILKDKSQKGSRIS